MALSTPPTRQNSYLNRIGYQAGLLGGICAIVSALILVVHTATTPKITEELRQDQLAMLDQILPSSMYNNDLLADARETPALAALSSNGSTTLYTAKWDGQVVGYAYALSEEGYSGTINLIIGIDRNGSILGVRVISHTETPGLGDKIEINRDNWILGFNQLSLTNTNRAFWAVKKDGGHFDHFTGATITPRAVVKAVLGGLDFFNNHQQEFNAVTTDDHLPATPTQPDLSASKGSQP